MEEELIRGDSAIIEFELTDNNDKNISLEDIDTLILTARIYPDKQILFTKEKEDFKVENDIYYVELFPEDTQELSIDKFFFDVEVTLKNNGGRGSFLGILKLKKDMTTHKSGGVDNEN